MKLMTDKGQLALPDDFSFEIEKTNPFFSDEGEQSIPVTIPRSPRNLAALGYPDRAGFKSSSMRRVNAQMRCGAIIRGGRLVIDTVGKDGIDAAIYLSESDMYSKSKDTSLKDLFDGEYRDDYSTSSDKVAAWASHLWQVMNGSRTDDFTVFPAFTDWDEEEDSVFTLNGLSGTQTNSGQDWDLEWASRTVSGSDGNETVPTGYGLTPFLYLHALIRLMLVKLGYTVTSNCFSSGDAAKIVVLNNNADTICAGKIHLADLMPSCTVSEFVTFLQDKFLCTIVIDTAAKTAKVVKMQDILSSSGFDVDISSIVDGMPDITFSDSTHIRLVSDTSLEGAEPAADTVEDFHKKYPYLRQVTESEYLYYANRTMNVLLRKATGQYYIVKKDHVLNKCQREELGSNCFAFERGSDTDTVDERKPGDLIPAIIIRPLPSSEETNTKLVLGPYIGERTNRNTTLSDEDDADSDEQKIILALDGGQAATDEYHSVKYRFGTTQKYNNLGVAFITTSLMYEDIYDAYWSAYNKILLGDNASMEAQVDYSHNQLASFDMMVPKLFNNVKVLCKKLSYSLGENTVCGTSEYLMLRNAGSDGTAPAFTTPAYGWTFNSNFETLKAQSPYSAAQIFRWKQEETYIYVAPPTSVGQTSAVFHRTIEIYYDTRQSTPNTIEADCYLLATTF